MLGRRKATDGDGVHDDAGRRVSGAARGEEIEGPSGDESDRRVEDEPRDILALCKHGDSLGIAAVSGDTIYLRM